MRVGRLFGAVCPAPRTISSARFFAPTTSRNRVFLVRIDIFSGSGIVASKSHRICDTSSAERAMGEKKVKTETTKLKRAPSGSTLVSATLAIQTILYLVADRLITLRCGNYFPETTLAFSYLALSSECVFYVLNMAHLCGIRLALTGLKFLRRRLLEFVLTNNSSVFVREGCVKVLGDIDEAQRSFSPVLRFLPRVAKKKKKRRTLRRVAGLAISPTYVSATICTG